MRCYCVYSNLTNDGWYSSSWEGYYNIKKDSTKNAWRKRMLSWLLGTYHFDYTYQRNFLPENEFIKFMEVLENEQSGPKLYENLCYNLEYIDSLKKKAKELDVLSSFQNHFYPMQKDFFMSCALRVLNENVNNLLKEPDEFKKWTKETVYNNSKKFYDKLFAQEGEN